MLQPSAINKAITHQAKNAVIFRRCLSDKNVTPVDFDRAIIKYAVAKYPESLHEAETAARNLRKELGRDNMTDKVLTKGLTILNYTEAEIAALLAAR